MQATQIRFDIDNWLNKAFRGNVPAEVAEMMRARQVRENVFREMLTQYPRELRDGLERLAEVQQADTEMMMMVIEGLFKRHLEDHAPSIR